MINAEQTFSTYCSTHSEDRSNQALVHKRIDTAIFDHRPCILRSRNVSLAVERDMAEGISVDKLHSPFKQTEQALKTAEEYINHDVAVPSLTLLCNRAEMTECVDYGHDEGTEGDRAEGVCQAALECAPCGSFGEVVRAEVP